MRHRRHVMTSDVPCLCQFVPFVRQAIQPARYVHSCQTIAILIEMSTTNPSQKSEPLTQDANLLRVVGVTEYSRWMLGLRAI